MRIHLFVWLFFGTFLTISCSQQPQLREQDGGVSDTSGPKAFVIGMLGESGAFGTLSVSTNKLLPAKGPVSNDAVARFWNGYMFVVNRLTHDNIQVMDTKLFSLVKQYSVGPKTNPQDIVVLNSNKAYISRLGSSSLLVVEPLSGKKLKEIDLGFLAEAGKKTCQSAGDCESKRCIKKHCAEDGLPELAQMYQHKDHVWVLAQRLNRNQRFTSQHNGKIALIDTSQDKVVKQLDTKAGNPYGIDEHKGILYVSQPGNWMSGTKVVLDGLLEKFDLTRQQSLGVALSEKELGGNLSSFAIVSETKAYAIRTGNNWKTELVSFNPSSGKVGTVILSSPCLTQGACYTLFSIAYHPSGKLYIVERHPKTPGIRILDTRTNKELTQTPLNIGLPPMSVVFYE